MSSLLRRNRLGALIVFIGPIIVGTVTTFIIFNRTGAAPDSAARWGTLLELLMVTSILTAVNLLMRWIRWHFLLRRFRVFIPGRRSLYIFALLLPAIMTPLISGEVLLALFLKGYSR